MFAIYLVGSVALAAIVFLLRKTRLANVALLFFTLALCFTGLEGYYRFVFAESSGFGRLGGENFYDRYYRFDAFGFRESNLPASDTKPNLVVLGDSFVFGAGLKSPADRFSNRLAARYPNLHVINLGLPGWETTDERAGITKYLGDTKARIPLVILGYFFNDIGGDVTAPDRERVKSTIKPAQAGTIDHALQRASHYSRFIELFYFRFGYPRLVSERLDQLNLFYGDSEVVSRHLATLEELRTIVANRFGARLLIVIIPYLQSDGLLNDTAFYQRFAGKLKERGLYYIDMQPTFARYGVGKLRVNRFDPHANEFANELMVGAIAAEVGEELANAH